MVVRVAPAAFVRSDEVERTAAKRVALRRLLVLLVFRGQRVRAGPYLRLDPVAGAAGIGQANFGIGTGASDATLAAYPVMHDPRSGQPSAPILNEQVQVGAVRVPPGLPCEHRHRSGRELVVSSSHCCHLVCTICFHQNNVAMGARWCKMVAA